MTQWATFVGLAGVVTVLLLVLSHATKTALTDDGVVDTERGADADAGASAVEAGEGERDSAEKGVSSGTATPTDGSVTEGGSARPDPRESAPADHPLERARRGIERDLAPDPEDRPGSAANRSAGDGAESPELADLSTGALLANVALSQGVLAAVLVGAAIYTEVPPAHLGIAFTREYLLTGLVLGTAIGVALYVANELGAAGATRFGIDHDEELRELLAPDTFHGWLVLLGLVLPIIAVFEEFLFRAALIGAVEAGFGVSPWLLAIGTSLAFALGHGMQGPAGVLVTAVLGFALAAAFVLTGSFLVVVVAHYLVNALEFVVHEGFGLEWAERWEGERAPVGGSSGR